MWDLLIKPISDTINNIVDKVAPDAGMAEKLKYEITQALIASDAKAFETQANVIMAEANGESWLQRNWRPLSAMTFVSLVVAHWLGFTGENLTEDVVLKLMDIVQMMIGGYVASRGAEKVMREYKK